MAPEITIGAWHFAVFISPRIPETTPMLAQQVDTGIAGKKPEVFDDNVFPGDLLGGQKGEALAQINLIVDIEC